MVRNEAEALMDIEAVLELAEEGPIVEATINGHAVRALIDTGAEATCVTRDLAHELGLPKRGRRWYDSRNNIEADIYSGTLIVSGRTFDEVPLNEFPIAPHKTFRMILVRDILVSFVLNYNGPEGTFSLQ